MYNVVRISTGEKVTEARSMQHGMYLIKIYEDDDKENGSYKKDDYDVVDQNGNSIL